MQGGKGIILLDFKKRMNFQLLNMLMKQTNCNYIDQLNKAEYAKSYKSLGDDDSIIRIAEEGVDDYNWRDLLK